MKITKVLIVVSECERMSRLSASMQPYMTGTIYYLLLKIMMCRCSGAKKKKINAHQHHDRIPTSSAI